MGGVRFLFFSVMITSSIILSLPEKVNTKIVHSTEYTKSFFFFLCILHIDSAENELFALFGIVATIGSDFVKQGAPQQMSSRPYAKLLLFKRIKKDPKVSSSGSLYRLCRKQRQAKRAYDQQHSKKTEIKQ